VKLPIPSDWDGETWCRWAICWPDSEQWLGVLRGFITLPQRGWTWDEKTGSILAVQEIGREITALNLPEKAVFMACGDEGLQEIAAAIRQLAISNIAIASAQCCDVTATGPNGGLVGTVVDTGGQTIPIFGTAPPIELGPGEFPPNYEDEASYLVDKCRLANMIIDGWIGTIRSLAALTLLNVTVLAVLIGLSLAAVIIMPPAAIPVMIIALLAAGGFLAGLDDLANGLQERRAELVCSLYNSDTIQAMTVALSDALDTIISLLGVAGPIGAAFKVIAITLVNADTLNQLLSGAAALGYADADCSDCAETEICFEFVDDLQGATLFEDLGGIVTLSWSSGNLRCDYTEPPPDYPRVDTGVLNHVVELGDNATVCLDTTNVGTLGAVAGVIIGGVPIELFATGTGASDIVMSLDAYEGQTIEKVYFGYTGAGLSYVEISRAGINCVC